MIPTTGQLVWDHYYCNHQKAGSFKNLRVLDPFMGGGTTLVEESRLGMQMAGVDLNPVAWFVVRNELACSDPEQVKALLDHIEQVVKPQIQPFYTTTCPRGHQGRWIDAGSGEPIGIDPIDLSPDQRSRYHWQGPEVIYTFWAKHGPCQAKGVWPSDPYSQNACDCREETDHLLHSHNMPSLRSLVQRRAWRDPYGAWDRKGCAGQ